MNKEYIYLSNKELIVTDEQGHLTKRVIESDNMHDVLMLENNLEKINTLINKIEEANKNEIKLNSKEKFIYYTIPFAFTGVLTAIVFGISVINSNPWLTVDYVSMLSSAILVSGAVDIFFVLGEKRMKKEKLGRDAQLSKAYEIKESIEKELCEIREKKEALEKSKKYNNLYEQSDIIVLEKDTFDGDKIIGQLNDSFMDGYNLENGPKLVLKNSHKK